MKLGCDGGATLMESVLDNGSSPVLIFIFLSHVERAELSTTRFSLNSHICSK